MIVKGLLKIILAIILVALGLVGFLIPIIPGWPLILLAIFLFRPDKKKVK